LREPGNQNTAAQNNNLSQTKNMHCPICGEESSLDQRFCRHCGFNLEPVSELVSGSAGFEAERAKAEQETHLVHRMFRWISWGCIVLAIGVVLLITNKNLVQDKLLQTLSTLIILGGTAIAMYGVLSSTLRGASLPRTSAPKTSEQISSARTTRELEEAKMPQPMPSVTERTTELIENKLRDE
jgi:hypothetical protein